MSSFFLSGDFRHFFPENLKDFVTFPLAWDSSLNTGIGHSQIGSLWITSFFNSTLLFSKLGLNWTLIQLIFWILPALLLSFFSSFYLFKTLFKFKVQYCLLAGIIYAFNTYFLMILTGGQLGVCLGYSLAPLVLLRFMKTIEKPSLKNSTAASLVLGLQLIFDPRIVYITILTVFIFSLFYLSEIEKVKNKIFLLMPFVVSVLLNSFWILPLIIFKISPIPVGFDSLLGFKFFSFADFSSAISLLHPNWPENIFGKTYFLKPEFLILAAAAFSSLLFTHKNNRRIILFFATLGLIGAYLAKGANEPFGEFNTWLFQNFPGMSMFRDPTKFYLLIALSYSMLIPCSITQISNRIKSQVKISNFKFQISNFILLFAICYLLFLLRPLWMGDIREKFKPQEVPPEYIQLKDFLNNQNEFFRTLWIPQWQRLGYFSNNHPAIGREEILKGDAQAQIEQLKILLTLSQLSDLSVRYVIVPFDSQSEIFLKDRKYDDLTYQKTVKSLRKIDGLREVRSFGKIAVFELKNYRDHFWSPSRNLKIKYTFIDSTKYLVQIENAKKEDILVFSEGFDKYWQAENSEFGSRSSKFRNGLNSFVLPKNGDYILKVYYHPQGWVNAGLGISGITLLVTLGALGFKKIKSK